MLPRCPGGEVFSSLTKGDVPLNYVCFSISVVFHTVVLSYVFGTLSTTPTVFCTRLSRLTVEQMQLFNSYVNPVCPDDLVSFVYLKA